MYDILSYLTLLIIAMLAYSIIIMLSKFRKRAKQNRLTLMLDRVKNSNRKEEIKTGIANNKFLKYFSIEQVTTEAAKCGYKMTRQEYLIYFVIGTTTALFFIFSYFNSFFIFMIPFSFVGGALLIENKLHKILLENNELTESKIIVYMSGFTSSIRTIKDIRRSLESVLPALESPIKEDVEKAMLHLADGQDVKTAFKEMNEKYKLNELIHFHDQVDIIKKSGAYDIDGLLTLVKQMRKKSEYRRKIQSDHRASLKIWKSFVRMTIIMPILFLAFGHYKEFWIIFHSPIVSLAYLFAFILGIFTHLKLERLQRYDPTIDEEIKFN